MGLIKITLMVFVLAIGCAYFIALLLTILGRLIKLMGFKEDPSAAIPGTPPGQIMPKAGTDYTAIAVAIAAAERESKK